MAEKQKTISKSVEYEGIGLHTGNNSKIIFHPAAANYGYKFVRSDLDINIEVPALTEYVTDLSRWTTIAKDGVEIHTVEHVLAALVGMGIDNCKIELNSNEPPIGDGSSLPYVEVLQQAGIKKLDEDKEYFEISEIVRYTNDLNEVDIVALPHKDYRLTVLVDYANPALGSQHTGLFDFEKEFVKEFAPARTFCFLSELESLLNKDLIKGGSLDNGIVFIDKESSEEELAQIKEAFSLNEQPYIGENGTLNSVGLRFKNEPARHKLLDMIGDLALVGVPIKAQILAARPGHASNIQLAKKIREQYLKYAEKRKYDVNKSKIQLIDINEILNILPHRYPFLLVDRVKSYDPETQTVVAYKNISFNEPQFTGHFPEYPIMPGVLILEAMAQVGGILIKLSEGSAVDNKMAFFMSINHAKFRKPIIPGDQMVMEVKLIQKKFNIFTFDCKAIVSGELHAEAEIQAALVENKSKNK